MATENRIAGSIQYVRRYFSNENYPHVIAVCDEVERLRAEVKLWADTAEGFKNYMVDARAERDTLLAACEAVVRYLSPSRQAGAFKGTNTIHAHSIMEQAIAQVRGEACPNCYDSSGQIFVDCFSCQGKGCDKCCNGSVAAECPRCHGTDQEP